ncbi:hypothetical protein O6H91_18G069900 [Diphasiastrum complanatum]|uniref:Uncharacterized protein n=1 Tax=Diphasiastrum complanatum TaxID=34168 RepID=A0ACC2B2G2_DIPCM|nr:hypothetical protein O6H91_18G069900 [Diphasiastrum complanatum]
MFCICPRNGTAFFINCKSISCMAIFLLRLLLLAALSIFIVDVNAGYDAEWEPATATWYGSPNGAGTDGGACGYGSLPGTPYGLDVTAGSPVLFKDGKGCGSCYRVKCMDGALCSNNPVTVVITDECPGGYCASGRTHFDLSGTAFSQMANPGRSPALLNSGAVQVLYERVKCDYEGTRLEFEINAGATPYWFAILIRYVGGSGDLDSVELLEAGSQTWQSMYQVWGANWCLNYGPLRAPFSIRLHSSGETITADNVIPGDWSPSSLYSASINFS